MKNLFLPFDLALLAVDHNFIEPCIACYDKNDMLATYTHIFNPKNYNNPGTNSINAPTYIQIIDWFREKYNLYVNLPQIFADGQVNYYTNDIYDYRGDYMIPHSIVRSTNPSGSEWHFPLRKSYHHNDETECYYELLNLTIKKAFSLLDR